MLLRRSMLPARLSTRGRQCHAPRRSPRSATPWSKMPRHFSSWLAPPQSSRTDWLRRATPDASGRLMQPTLSKTSTHAPGSRRRVSPAKNRSRRRARRFNDVEPTSASGSRRHTECSRLRMISVELVSGASSPPGRMRAIERAAFDPGDQDRSCHRPIEERWIPWSETPSAGWKALVEPASISGVHRVHASFDS